MSGICRGVKDMCEFRTNDGGCTKTNRQCVENGCAQWEQASEARYQMYIDNLHRQIDELTAQLDSWIETATSATTGWAMMLSGLLRDSRQRLRG